MTSPTIIVARIPNVAEGDGSGEFGAVLSAVDVLAGPERLSGGTVTGIVCRRERWAEATTKSSTDKPTTSESS